MMKSPEQKMTNYQTIASNYIEHAYDSDLITPSAIYLFDEAYILLNKALELNPYSQTLKADLLLIVDQKTDFTKETSTAFLPHKELIQ